MNIISQLAQCLNKPEDVIEDILFIGPERYKLYYIPKRTHGVRLIAQPSRELKECQRAFLSFFRFPVHNCAMAYREGMSIKDNALAHKNNAYLLKLDLENFFNSINPNVFWDVWKKLELLNLCDNEKKWIEKILFWNLNGDLVLSVGAPSSPVISNFCMYIFDSILKHHCDNTGIIYTRYADDLTFSTNKERILFQIPSVVEKILSDCFNENLYLNKSKTTFSSKAHNRHVTGITLTNEGKISLGRSKKRYIKHKIHQFSLGKLDNYDIMHLKGLLSFSRHIEPTFYESLIKKHSRELITSIFEVSYE
ncbi:retron St85 family RNA-directed DNA polymerase [Vibrio alginolyticus]|uniref:retron St85 family RNA-directed DNA polymerase n=1 Tax=Vibrio alginolyticus TaxID=663 RepID=UPI00215BEC53|nr:retron St85 family RNA-directed DNA polymerase [Vibrio alginolyticus]MCR9328425.1 retron St85 family RNA-directed DNA polymerase [Vibrio alginolyticus]MCR9356797.1 retron St85 family RNA-directed DNA polymerase [Vibrio alginolyticus]